MLTAKFGLVTYTGQACGRRKILICGENKMLITQLKKRPQRKSKAQTETGIFYFTTRSSGVKKLEKKDQSNKLQKIYNVKRDDLIKIYTKYRNNHYLHTKIYKYDTFCKRS